MRFTKLFVSFGFLFACLFGATLLSAQSKTGDACLTIKTAVPQGVSMMPFRAIKKLDPEIQSCIEDKIKGGALKDDGISVKVSGGEAVLEGKSKVPGHKGGATRIAKGCGAQKVTNNIVVSKPEPRPSPSPKK